MGKIWVIFASIVHMRWVQLIFLRLQQQLLKGHLNFDLGLVFLLIIKKIGELFLILAYDPYQIINVKFYHFSQYKKQILASYCLSNILNIQLHQHSKILHILILLHQPSYLSICFSNTFLTLQIQAKYALPTHADNYCANFQNIFILNQSSSQFLDPLSYPFPNFHQNSCHQDSNTFFLVQILNHF